MKLAVDGIAFDAGNTLILDPFPKTIAKKVFDMKKTLAQSGYIFEENEIIDAWNEANNKINYPFVSHFYQEKKIVDCCLDLLKIAKKDKLQLVSSMLIIYRSGLKSVVSTEERLGEIRDVLSQLKNANKRLVVFGNGRQKNMELFLEWSGLLPYFRLVTSSEKLGIEKPDPRVFNYIMKTLESDRKRCMYIGDDEFYDIIPARKAGMFAVKYIPPLAKSTPWRDYKTKMNVRPNAVIRDFRQLLDIIK